MLKKLLVLGLMVSIAACARRQPPPEPEPEPAPPVEISEEPEPAPTPPPPVEEPPPPDTPAKPLQTDTGRFRIAIASLDSAELTAKWVSKAEAAGYRTEVLAVEIDGKTWHRVLLPGYESLAEAQAALPFVQQELGAQGAWVTSRRRAPGPADAPAEAPPPPAPEATPAPEPEKPAS
jgi:cell division septation protein DedD